MHIYKNRLKVLLRSKSLIFWTLVFPIILGTFFNLAFSNLITAEKFNPIKVGIISNEAYNNLNDFKTVITGISQKNTDQVLDVTYYQDEDTAKKALNDNKIVGYYQVDTKINIIVKTSGTNQTIMKFILDNYYQTYSVITNIMTYNPSGFKSELINELNGDNSYFNSKTVGNLDLSVSYFYTLIGMVCLYGGFFGVNAVSETEANLSKRAARLSVAPTNKLKSLLMSLFAGYTVQVIEALILLIYLVAILHIDFGTNIPQVILMILVGSFAGITFGTLIGVSNRKNENMKVGLVISISMICSFFAGMMMDQMKYIISVNAPIINKINPVAMITDGLYSLYYYGTFSRYYFNILSLIIFSCVMIFGSFLFIRRKKYDSI